jgi:hypothetical protein
VGARIDSSSTYNVTVTGNSTDLIDGSNIFIMTPKSTAEFKSDGTSWQRIGGNGVSSSPITVSVASSTAGLSFNRSDLANTVTLTQTSASIITTGGGNSIGGTLQVTSATAPPYGAGVEIDFNSVSANTGRLLCINRTSGTRLPLVIDGSAISLCINGADVVDVTSAGITSHSGLFVDTSTNGGNGCLFYNSYAGLGLYPKAGSGYDFNLLNVSGSSYAMVINHGVSYPTFQNSGTYNGTWGTGSDLRLKTDVKPLKNGLASALSVETITYRWNEESECEDKETVFMGVSAQSVQKVFPTAVMEDHRGYLTVDYGKLSTLAFAAIKELAEQNKHLSARIDALESGK